MAISAEMQAIIDQGKAKFSRNSAVAKFAEGDTQFRIVKYKNEPLFYRERGLHWIKADPNVKPLAVMGCSEAVEGKPCSVCAAVAGALGSVTDDEALQLYKSWEVRKSIIVNAVIKSGPHKSEITKLQEMPSGVLFDIMTNIDQYSEDYDDILDPEKGFDFLVTRVGKDKHTKYSTKVLIVPDAKRAAGSLTKAQIDGAVDLDAWIKKEDFRESEEKALHAISGISGITPARLGAPRGTALLTSGAGSVAGAAVKGSIDIPSAAAAPAAAPVAPVAPTPATPVAAAPAASPEFGASLDDDELNAMFGELEGIDS